MSFVHLHGHSEYSSLDGAGSINDIIDKVKELKQPAVALTEHGNVDSGFKFYHACKKKKIKPIMGCEFYFAQNGRNNKGKNTHLVLLAKNYQGWQNILRMVKISSFDGFYYKPRIDFSLLEKYSEGIIALTACLKGIVPYHILLGNIDKAHENLERLQSIFKDDLYVELQYHYMDDDKRVTSKLIELAFELNIKTVITNDFHYINKEDAIIQDLLMCEGLKASYNSQKRLKLPSDDFYIKSREEMLETLKAYDKKVDEKLYNDILDETLNIAKKCNVKFPEPKLFLPDIKNAKKRFNDILDAGKEKHIKLFTGQSRKDKEYEKQLKEEIKVIEESGLIKYFLTVHDFIRYAKENNIIVGAGRGSVGGCLVGFLMGIHSIDPIKYGLMFSRFYNPGRKGSLPDIDIDFSSSGIKKILHYIEDKYTTERVSHIGTFTTYAPRGSFKAICRIMDIPYFISNNLVGLIDHKASSLTEALEDKTLKEKYKSEEEIANGMTFKELYDYAIKIEGKISHTGIHAAGIIISPENLDNLIPLRYDKRVALPISCWDMKDVEKAGLIKYDFLRIDILDAIKEVLSYKHIPYNTTDDIPVEGRDKRVKNAYDLISHTNNVGVFQLSGAQGVDIANQLMPQTMEEIAVAITLNRPGCINVGVHTKYIRRKYGDEEIPNDYPLFADILDDTYELMIYQEQIIKMCMKIGFTALEADKVRKAIGKKKIDIIKQLKPEFYEKALKYMDEDKIDVIWKQMNEAASYMFNKSHAVGYGHISYYTAFLKANYPIEYMCALLNISYGDRDKLNIYLEECRNLGIEIKSPSVTKSKMRFTIEGKGIRYGLLGIKGVGSERMTNRKTSYLGFTDFCKEENINKTTLEVLIKSGALDEFGYNRNTMLKNIENVINILQTHKRNTKDRRQTLFDVGMKINITKHKELSNEKLANMEYEILNTYLKYNPLQDYRELVNEYNDDREVIEDEEELTVAGYVQSWTKKKTKRNTDYSEIILYTPKKIWKILFFGRNFEESLRTLENYKIIWVNGKYSGNAILADSWGAV